MPNIVVRRGDLAEHDSWKRHRLAYKMNLWGFSYTYAVNTMDIDQEIDGIKTFNNFPVLPGGFPIEDEQAANKFYVDYTARTSVTAENLYSNGDVGVNSGQVARGDHGHDTLPTDDQKDALDTSNNPSSSNPFVTWGQFSDHSTRHITVGQDKIDNVTPLVSGLMSATDKTKLNDVIESVGSLYTHENGLQVVAALADTAYLIDGLTEGYVTANTSRIVMSGANGKFTVKSGATGRYLIQYDASFFTNKGAIIHFHLLKNGVERDECSFQRDIFNANDVGSGATHTILDLAADDYLEVWVESDTVNTDIDIDHMNFSIIRLIQ